MSLKALPTNQQTDQTGSNIILLYFFYSLAIVLFLLSLHISCKWIHIHYYVYDNSITNYHNDRGLICFLHTHTHTHTHTETITNWPDCHHLINYATLSKGGNTKYQITKQPKYIFTIYYKMMKQNTFYFRATFFS